MKGKILILVMAILGSSLVYANQTEDKTVTNCEKKVLKKIKRKMNAVNFMDYVKEGHKCRMNVSYFINQDKEVVILKIEGGQDDFKEAILETFEKHPVICDFEPSNRVYTFRLVFEHHPA